jgi:thioredoxin-like negative regulator of GroEL
MISNIVKYICLSLGVMCCWAQPSSSWGAPASRPTSQATKTTWLKDNLKAAFAQSAGKKPILVLTNADWCSPCKQLMYEVIDTPKGRALTKKATCVSINFDRPTGRAVATRYHILGLPTTLVLSPKGREIGRIVGYQGQRMFLRTLQDLLAGRSNTKHILARYKAQPHLPKHQLDFARMKLVNGDIKTAKPILKKLFSYEGTDPKRKAMAARAARIWGRYLIRVKRNNKAGTIHFLAAMKRFRGHGSFIGMMYWAAMGLHLQGQKASALKLLTGWAKTPKDKRFSLLLKADFMVHYHYPPNQIEPLLQAAIKRTPKRAWLWYMLAKVHHRKGQKQAARASIKKAMTLQPNTGMYIYFSKKLEAP